MEKLRNILPDLLNKYKYAILIVAVGIVLMLLPGREVSKENINSENSMPEETQSLETRIENVLRNIYGAGEVSILLTVSEGEEIIYQENVDNQFGNNNESYRTDTVITVDTQRNETGLIKQTISPRYLGAVIVCQGADDPTIKLAIIDAVSKATGLRSDKISVLKMK